MGTGELLLAGDIGGTKTRLALYENSPQGRHGLSPLRDNTFPSSNYHGLESIIAEFLAAAPSRPVAACFGVAGPVIDGRCQTTNLPWVIEESAISNNLGIPAVRLLNDLQVMALGLAQLPAEELIELNPQARPSVGNIAVIAAGTGCGEALLYWDGATHHAIATEGGHSDFAPNSREQEGLLRWLRTKFGGHVSYERILSGPGLYNVYQYLREEGVASESLAFHAAVLAGQDPGKLISQFGLQENDLLCRETLRMFVRIFGAEAGNWALKTLSNGGVLVGGGVAAKILPAITNGDFITGFRNKGRFTDWLGGLSVKVALNQDAGLIGASLCAAELLA
jgi:glucokinase